MKRLLPHATLLLGALALVALVPMLSGCDLTELNEDPNEPGEVKIPFLLTNAQTDLADDYWGSFELGRFGNLYAQYWSQTQYVNESRYQYPTLRASSNSALWNAYYFALNDLEEMARISRQEPGRAELYGNPQDIVAMAKIMQVWIWQTLTDIYGAIPFEGTLSGRDNSSPAYTSQEAVYKALIDTLTVYSQQLTGGETLLGDADVLFEGDTDLWKAFANGLKMRLAIRMSFADEATAETAFVEAFNAASFTDVSGNQNALVPFLQSPQEYVNPIYGNSVIGGRDDWGVSEPLLSIMNANEDPRRAAYAQKSTATDEYIGFPYGLTQGAAIPIWASGRFSRPSRAVAYTATAPAILYAESEELFMLAEAAQRGWISGSAEQYYNDAIRASMAYWDEASEEATIDETAVDAYLAKVPYDAANWQQSIGVQKWLALYMQGVQGWSVFRRLDFDGVFVVPPGDPGNTNFGSTFPVRLPYPQEEPSLNGENYNQAVTQFLGGTDNQGMPLWWDDDELGEPKE